MLASCIAWIPVKKVAGPRCCLQAFFFNRQRCISYNLWALLHFWKLSSSRFFCEMGSMLHNYCVSHPAAALFVTDLHRHSSTTSVTFCPWSSLTCFFFLTSESFRCKGDLQCTKIAPKSGKMQVVCLLLRCCRWLKECWRFEDFEEVVYRFPN